MSVEGPTPTEESINTINASDRNPNDYNKLVIHFLNHEDVKTAYINNGNYETFNGSTKIVRTEDPIGLEISAFEMTEDLRKDIISVADVTGMSVEVDDHDPTTITLHSN